jgi:hypothetical protein
MKRVAYRITLIVIMTLSALYGASAVIADIRDNPPPLAGFTHNPAYADDSPQRHGILLSGAVVGRSSPVIANISTTSSGNEVAVAGSDGRVYVFARTGGASALWETNVFASSTTPGCAGVNGDARLNSSPAVADIDNDGVPEVVIGYGTIQPSNCDGGLVALNGNTGAVEWRFSLRAWQASQGYPPEGLYGVVSTPALSDVDGNGTLEVGFGGLDRHLYLLNSNGSVRFYYHAADTVWSSPAFANVDGDAQLEMIIGTDITANPFFQPPVPDGGYMYAFDTQQRNPLRLEFGSGFLWRTVLEQVMYSSPAVGDVLPGNPGAEIVIGSGCWFPSNSTNKLGKWVKILRLSDGAVLSTLNAPACLRSSPALGDIDNDGKLEVVVVVTGATEYGGDTDSKVVAWDPDTGAQKWVFRPLEANAGPTAANNNDPHGDDLQSPVLADLDGNGSLEVIVANMWTVHVVRGDTGAALTCQSNACFASELSLWGWWTLKSTPAVGDVDGDGDLEVVIGGGHAYATGGAGVRGMLYAWTNFQAAGLASPGGTQADYSAPWPMFRGGARRDGQFPLPSLLASHTVLPIFQSSGTAGPVQAAFQVINQGGGTLNWSSSASGGLVLTPDSGSTASQTTVHVQVTVPAVANGVYNLGTIVLTSSNGLNSPMNVVVRRFVGPLRFLPLVQR